ncbi:hypothetical protein AGABI2DRAFT_195185 [Agaricus bisporus var. bisporus H97]|uniref:hypothetical protein n=1 Tax=Agaricus bisporus var. bisporus (strain H97 / ATCC MYA-4626 / FGSC 10389) TaxID=936046 RepID=UPI00029F6119|nr:hypothetical protein AGABI2DRAFT_195185 [Agaricus bisporus var. bisporus H97]EKV43635.1 hypothetical protein AGABI2DRAFT_195185 [Agaricus bisporus var. bisporus H97]
MYFPNLEYLYIDYDATSFTDPYTLTELESFIGRLKTRNATPLKSFHWYRHCNYYANPTPAPPHVAATQSRTVFRLLPKTLSNLRVTLFPRFLLEKLFNVLTTEGTFLPELKTLDLGIDVSVLISPGEFDWFCDKLKLMMATTKRQLHEFRIQLLLVDPRPRFTIPPWQIIFRLDGWKDILRDDVERNLGCSIGREEDEFMSGTDAESIWVKNLRRALLEFMRSDDVLSQHNRLRTNPLFRLETINRWLKLFKTNANSRRWTSLGHDGIMYVSPRSPLRESESWVYGVSDDPSDAEDIRYIDNDRVPGVPCSWLDVRDLTMYFSPNNVSLTTW